MIEIMMYLSYSFFISDILMMTMKKMMIMIEMMMMMIKSDNDNIPSYSVRTCTQRTHRTYLRVSGNRHRSYWHPLHIGAIHWSQEDIVLWHTYNDDYDDFDDDNFDDDNDEEE